jgi:flagellar basal-body rod modification protein FlgD
MTTSTASVSATPPVTGTTSAQATINNSLASLADNSQTFLTLLTTQLKNQDPLSPLDTNQFTSQLTQMSGVEQQLLGNQLLQTLVSQQTGVGQAASLIGSTATAPSATSGASPVTGQITSVEQVNGTTDVTIGNQQVPYSSITSVTYTPPSTSSTGS